MTLWHEDRAEVSAYQPHQLCHLDSPTFVLEFIILVGALCGCAQPLSMMIGTLLFILVLICCVVVYFDK